jgi:hypothetical protein
MVGADLHAISFQSDLKKNKTDPSNPGRRLGGPDAFMRGTTANLCTCSSVDVKGADAWGPVATVGADLHALPSSRIDLHALTSFDRHRTNPSNPGRRLGGPDAFMRGTTANLCTGSYVGI